MLSYSWLYSVWGHFSIEQSGQTHAQYFVHEHFCLCICQQFASSFSCKTLVTGCYALPLFMSWTTISHYSIPCSIPVGAQSCSFWEFDHTTTPALRTKEWASSSFASSSYNEVLPIHMHCVAFWHGTDTPCATISSLTTVYTNWMSCVLNGGVGCLGCPPPHV